MFSQPESSKISDTYVAVRLLGGNDLDDEGREFMAHYGVGGYPTLLAMTADGAVVGREFQRTLEGILQAMEGAATADAEFRAREKEIGKSQLPEALREMAGLYKARNQYDQARANYEKLVAKDPKVEDQVGLLEVLTAQDAKDERKALLKALVETRKDHEDHLQWRIDLATADLPTKITSREQYMEMLGGRQAALEKLVAELEKPADQAVVRHQLADVLARLNQADAAVAHWQWILENAADSPLVPDVQNALGMTLFNQGMMTQDLDKMKRGRALFQKILDEHGSSPLAQRLQRVLPRADQLIKEAEERKAAEEKAAEEKKKDDGGEPSDGGEDK